MTYFKAGTEPTDYCTDHIENPKKKSKHNQSPVEAPEENGGKDTPWYKKLLGS